MTPALDDTCVKHPPFAPPSSRPESASSAADRPRIAAYLASRRRIALKRLDIFGHSPEFLANAAVRSQIDIPLITTILVPERLSSPSNR
jgi:hypothetical protein